MNRPTTLDVPRDRRAAFTLVEIVIAITIVAILVGMAIPTMRGLEDEKVAREPVSELLRLARTVRARAMAEQQPYQIAFDHRGFHAARYFNPYGESEEFDELVREAFIAYLRDAEERITTNPNGGRLSPLHRASN